ncbi:hypothetical protein EYB26_002947 [Talaromyces marneffei]|uniref:uncharacterized protein n=1 Tax=Talaromyces marneffei TaxID=37727 RepID=UPI0012A816EE|nr:uncharacterized protein EYB26_002947 [Talaromyces marneffei]QGA15290.1 hypothetical protein EYB26_002947 [Talaromyces marneffei]
MPLDEEGAKWSCEPCMRGHRSSKCQHFDRLMMKVPKAGRPLAKCPHPKGTCSCEKVYAFMVRIPKGSTCLCRPLYQVPASSAAETQSVPTSSRTPSLPPNPTIPTPTTAAPGRIQKHTRRPSNFQNPSDNVIKALDSELIQADYKNDIRITTKTATLDRSVAYTPVSGDTHTPSYDPGQSLPIKAESKLGGCCSAKTKPVTPTPEPQQRSCCGGGTTPRKKEEQVPNMPENRIDSAWNESFYGSQGLSWNAQLPNTDFAPQNNTYTTMNMKASYYNQPQSNQSAMPRTFHNMDTQYQTNISGPPMHPFYLNTASYPFDMSLPFVDDSNHNCSCGDSCQCLGCASHPYNETTRQHVQEMGYLMTIKEDEEKSGTSSPFTGLNSPPAMLSNIPSNPNNPVRTNAQPSFTDDNALSSTFDNTINSPTLANNQFMQPSEYYTIEYPVGLNLCSDITGTCQCGNDCSCVGCITHSGHDGIVLGSMPTEGQVITNPAPQQQFHDHYSQNPDNPRSMDQYSPSRLSPPVIETPLV